MSFFMVYLIALAAILAFWEIQIEGKNGWASSLPCWRVEKGWMLRLMGGRPLTGYHFFMVTFLVFIIHLPLFFLQPSWQLECLLLGLLVGFLTLEDFLWFVFNPNYRLRNFRRGKIWWHKNWWGPVPDFYWVCTGISVTLIYFGRQAIR